jgi:hypothetical protein
VSGENSRENGESYSSNTTTLIKQLQEVLTQQDKKHIRLCPTNLAALLGGGNTIHKFSTKLKKQSQIENLDLDYIFIDENQGHKQCIPKSPQFGLCPVSQKLGTITK